jgi:hypothetical protein
MSEVDSHFVKRGLWTDLEKGPVMGKTITTDTQSGAFVIALLAILSSLATAHLWHLVTFLIHQLRANGRTRDALFRQQQAILRTLPTPGALIADSLKLYWHWKRKEGQWLAFARVSLLVLLAVLFVGMTWTASIFSSLAVDTSQLRVLVSSPDCGRLNLTFDTMGELLLSYITDTVTVAEPFAESCYLGHYQSLPGLCDARKSHSNTPPVTFHLSIVEGYGVKSKKTLVQPLRLYQSLHWLAFAIDLVSISLGKMLTLTR